MPGAHGLTLGFLVCWFLKILLVQTTNGPKSCSQERSCLPKSVRASAASEADDLILVLGQTDYAGKLEVDERDGTILLPKPTNGTSKPRHTPKRGAPKRHGALKELPPNLT